MRITKRDESPEEVRRLLMGERVVRSRVKPGHIIQIDSPYRLFGHFECLFVCVSLVGDIVEMITPHNDCILARVGSLIFRVPAGSRRV